MTNQDFTKLVKQEFVSKGLVEDLIVSVIAQHTSAMRIDNKAFEGLIHNLTDSVYNFINDESRSYSGC